MIEVADVLEVLPATIGDLEARSAKVKVVLQQAFKKFGPVLEVRVEQAGCDAIAVVRFASARTAESIMRAVWKTYGFMNVGDGVVRVRQPAASDLIWQQFATARIKAPQLEAEPKKKKLRPNERFGQKKHADDADDSKPEAAKAADTAPPPDPERPLLLVVPDRPEPAELTADNTDEDKLVIE